MKSIAPHVERALAAAQDAQAALPNQPSVIEALGVAQLASGQPQAAISTFAQLAGMLPKSPEPLERQAQAYLAAKRPDDAIQVLRQALNLSPGQPDIESQIAAIYVSTGRSDEAMQEARSLQAKQPDKPLGYVLEAEIDAAVTAVQAVYLRNVFPNMKLDWGYHPNNIGHEDFLGCFRCHDGKHKSSDGRVISKDCNLCHQLTGQKQENIPAGAKTANFVHPVDIGDELVKTNCNECHTAEGK